MVVDNFDYLNAPDLTPVVLTVFISGNRVFVRGENQPVRLIEIAGPLPFSIFPKLMVITGQVAHILQCFSGPQVIKPLLYFVGPDFTQLFLKLSVVIGQLA